MFLISIDGNLDGFTFCKNVKDDGECAQSVCSDLGLVSVRGFGNVGFGKAPFAHCRIYIATDEIPLPPKLTSLKYAFEYADYLDLIGIEGYHGISRWDVSNVTDMSGAFLGSPFDGDISAWNVGNVTDMERMFKNAYFNGDISKWDVSKVADMHEMFSEAERFNRDISNWNVSNVTDMSRMFYRAASFNGDISKWNVSKVANMQEMFREAEVFNQDISKWDVSNVTNMQEMFSMAAAFNQDISGWDVSNVTNMVWMFVLASSFDQNLSGWTPNIDSGSGIDSIFEASGVSTENFCAMIATEGIFKTFRNYLGRSDTCP